LMFLDIKIHDTNSPRMYVETREAHMKHIPISSLFLA
jgi:hypothetical protein